ncbi:BET1-like protein isoform X2 [Heterodontus francisci]|uniref:BET1-like protein isoform X2 n=1 Tax=Heterodontus francisci TaxID=7792 RepID=UPI00355C06E3
MAERNRGLGSSAVDQMLDAENKRMADNLSSKVSRLKSDSDFLSVTGLLTGSVKRFSTMVKSGRDNKKLLCYISVGLVLLFFIFYYLVTRIQT